MLVWFGLAYWGLTPQQQPGSSMLRPSHPAVAPTIPVQNNSGKLIPLNTYPCRVSCRPVFGGRLPPQKKSVTPPQIFTDFIFFHPEPPTPRLLPPPPKSFNSPQKVKSCRKPCHGNVTCCDVCGNVTAVLSVVTILLFCPPGEPAKRQFGCFPCPGGHICLNGTITPQSCGTGEYTKNGQYECKECKIGWVESSSSRLSPQGAIRFILFLIESCCI